MEACLEVGDHWMVTVTDGAVSLGSKRIQRGAGKGGGGGSGCFPRELTGGNQRTTLLGRLGGGGWGGGEGGD